MLALSSEEALLKQVSLKSKERDKKLVSVLGNLYVGNKN